MRINFGRVEIHNFKSFADEVFDFSQFNGLNLICGKNNDIPGAKNGSGKSNLISALVYCLFGNLQNSLKNENIRNKYINSKEVRVVASLSINDIDYRIASGFAKNGSPYCNVVKIEDNAEVDITKSTIAETRKLIVDEILHCDLSMFLRTVVLSSDQTYNFFLLRKGEKKDFIEKLFDISVFGEIYDSLHRDVLDYDKDMLKLQSKLMMLNNNNDQYTTQSKQHEDQTAEKIKALEESLEKLKSQKEEIQKKHIDINIAEVDKYEAASNKLTTAIDKLKTKIADIDKSLSKHDVALHKNKNIRAQKQSDISKHTDILKKLCADCSQVFKDYYNITTTQNDIKRIDAAIAEIQTSMSNANKAKSDAQLKLDDLSKKLNIISKKIESLTSESTAATRDLELIEQRISWTKNDIQKAKLAKNPYLVLLESNNKSIADESKKLEDITEKYKYLKAAEAIVSQDTLRKFIIKDLIGLLNNKIKYYLTKFGADYTVVFDADMDYEFITNGGTCEYNNFSAGERQRIMLATCFAFRDFMAIRSNLSSNILVLDEFIDGNVDAVAIDGVVQTLKEFSKMYSQNIFLISHRQEVDNTIFNNIIQVQRTDHISKVVVQNV